MTDVVEKKKIAHRSLHLNPENSSPENVLWGHEAQTSEGFPSAAGRCKTANLSQALTTVEPGDSSFHFSFSAISLDTTCILPSETYS